MNRFLCFLLCALLLCPALCGCGKDDGGQPSDTAVQALTPQDGDTMHLNMLFTLIGTPDIGVTELLGDGTGQKYRADGSLRLRTFEGTACGVELAFTVYYDKLGDVSSIDADFPTSVSIQQLTETVNELTGRKPSEDGTWMAETAVVSLTEAEDHVCMKLDPIVIEIEDEPQS